MTRKNKKNRPDSEQAGGEPAARTDATSDSLQGAASPPAERFPIVGIGASAGGLAALKTFFSQVPHESGFSFVVVVHLAPEHKSHLPELLQPHVKMPVQQVTETTWLQPDRVYVIPPNANLDSIDTHLRLSKLEERRQERAPIDHFFRTLAKSHEGDAIGVILTGTGSDGTLGLKEIKARGGLTVVQDPNEAEYDGMPQSAIATGQVDLILPLAGIPEAVLRYASIQPRVPIPSDDNDEDVEAGVLRLLHKVFAHLRARTGRDFARYKRSTILRRIQRRMQLLQIEELPRYLERLREQPEEVRILADDLLITVTSFFRDKEVFQKLERQVVPELFRGKTADDELRVWSVGCATGEEAYSLAMLLLEEAARRDAVPRLQLFASDLHESSLKRARDGFYPGDIETDVSAERLKRFFIKETGGYRIRKEVREMVIFAPHNLFSDPPFSRLDLISCRNVLIYIQREVQRDLIGIFHYALRADGYLLLGTSETVDGTELFRLEDKKHCIYRKHNVHAQEPRLPVFPLTRPRLPGDAARAERAGEPLPYGVLHSRMVERFALPSALISPDDKIAHLSDNAGRYLVHPGGELTAGVYKLFREELRIELRSVLHAARAEARPINSKPILVRFNGDQNYVILHVRPAVDPNHAGFALVSFEELESLRADGDPEVAPGHAANSRALRKSGVREAELETEVALIKQRLQAIIEEYETSQEEMKASNEEMQSTNEELRSTLEELETSKEELQSMNEELQTVNQENRHKVEELAQLSSDLQNLLAATNIATLFIDRDLRILRFTPQVSELFNIRSTDRSRPITDLTHRLGYDELQQDARQVLDKLIPIEREVQDQQGNWYLTRIMPYRSSDDRIQGAVITFVDITARRNAETEVRGLLDQLKEADQRKDEFLATLSHELRNPLAPISNFLQLLANSQDKAACFQEGAPAVQRQMHNLLMLVNDLLEVARIKHGKLRLRKTLENLNDVVRGAIDSAAAILSANNTRLITHVTPEILPVRVDSTRLCQAIHNLLENAAKYSPHNALVVLSTLRNDGFAEVVVQDSGNGIPADRLDHIFEMFTQLEQPTGRVKQGLGVGLALSRRLIELHDGTLTASSDGPDRGSTFTVRIPLDCEPIPQFDSAQEVRATASSGSRRVLVVDDNIDSNEMLTRLVKTLGHEVRQACDGREALRVAAEFRPDVVLMDIGMPILDGYDAAKQIREQQWGQAMILVALTGWGQDEDRKKCILAGYDHHIVKPVDLSDLERILAEPRGQK